jgi:Amt family ammonium transporter
MVSGAIAGLVSITPAAGYVDPTGAFIIGLLGGPVCYFGAQVKHHAGFDDALDAFGVHAIGGIYGGIMTGFFATSHVAGFNADGVGIDGVFYAGTHIGGTQLGKQIYGIVVVAGWAAFMSFIILMALDMTIGLRVTDEQEEEGLDEALHKESIFDSQHGRRVPMATQNTSDKEKQLSIDVMKSIGLEMTHIAPHQVAVNEV